MRMINDNEYFHFADITPYYGDITEGPFCVVVIEDGDDFEACLRDCIEDTFIQWMHPDAYADGTYDIEIDHDDRYFEVSIPVGDDDCKYITGTF